MGGSTQQGMQPYPGGMRTRLGGFEQTPSRPPSAIQSGIPPRYAGAAQTNGKGGGNSGQMVAQRPQMGQQQSSPKGAYKGAGQMSMMPTGQPTEIIKERIKFAQPGTGPEEGVPHSSGQYQGAGQMVPVPGAQGQRQQQQGMGGVPPINTSVQPGLQLGQQTIGRATREGLQDINRQFAGRGLGRSGLQLRAAQEAITRGSQRQAGDLANQLAMTQFERDIGGRGQALKEALGFGGLGLQQRAAGLAEEQARHKYLDAPAAMGSANLLQSLIGAGAGGGKGK